MDWRRIPDGELEAHFNPRVAVPDHAELLARFTSASAEARQRFRPEVDIRYGDGPRQVLDLFRAASPGAPIHIYFHGGYWRALAKSDFSLIAPPLTAAGAGVVIMDHDLCPDVTLDRIVAQALECVRWVARHARELGGDAGRIYLSGHSAGAHLAAMALARDWTHDGLAADLIKGAVLVSGIYDPSPVLRISVNDDVRLTPAMAARNNACGRPPRGGGALLVAVGGDEPAGWIGQSVDYHTNAGPLSELMVVADANHFSLGLSMADPADPLCQAMIRQMGLGAQNR